MGSFFNKVTHEFPPFFRIYKDGSIERFTPVQYSPPIVYPETGVQSKDVVISPETGVKARIFIPKMDSPHPKKLPLIVHYHAGAFCVGSSLDSITSGFLNIITSSTNAITVSVEYRLAPEHPLPTAYDDSWSAMQWISSHLNGKGPEFWLNEYVDFDRVFLMGESAGANIAHNVAVRVGVTGLEGFKVSGAVIAHPYFEGSEPNKLIQFLYPGSSGTDSDPKLNPKSDPDLVKMDCDHVLVFVAENDEFGFKPRGVEYCDTLRKSGWKGTVELVENEGEGHCFHLFHPTCDKALLLFQKLASFVNKVG